MATAVLGGVVVGGLLGLVASAAQQPAPTGVYTASQAENGRAAYTRSCAICHRTDFQGNFEAPPLVGTNFLNYWRDRTPRELFEQIRGSMPPDQPGRLGDPAYLDIVAYLLQANGAPAGEPDADGNDGGADRHGRNRANGTNANDHGAGSGWQTDARTHRRDSA